MLFLIPGDQLERLVLLESEFGVLPGFTPAVDAVINFVTTVRLQKEATMLQVHKSMTTMLLECVQLLSNMIHNYE